MKKYKTLILGTGMISRFHMQAVETSDRFESLGCISYRNDDWKARLAKGDVELLIVATASGAHDEAVFEAAKHRIPALVEKPLAITVNRIKAMAKACEETNTPLGCICQTCFTPAFRAVEDAVRGHKLGRITFARVDVPWWRDDEYYTKSSWHGSVSMDGGGALMNQSIHMIDWLTALMPPIAEVKGFAATLAHPMEAEDTACAAIRFEGGALGSVYGTTASWPGRAKTLEITGTRGTIVIKDHTITEWNLADGSSAPENAATASATHGSSRPDQIDASLHKACFEAFADSLDGIRKYEIDASRAIRSVDLINRITGACAL